MNADDAFLARMQEGCRNYARKKMRAGAELSNFERELLGSEYVEKPAPPSRSLIPSAPPPPTRLERVVKALCPEGIKFRSPFLARLNAHAIQIAFEHHITVHRLKSMDGASANPEARTVSVPAVTSEQTYSTFLHECGHILSPDGDSRQYSFQEHGAALCAPSGEIGAWKFAVKNALEWTAEMQRDMAQCLLSYARMATPDEEFEMRRLLTDAAFSIKERPITFGELCEQQKAVKDAQENSKRRY